MLYLLVLCFLIFVLCLFFFILYILLSILCTTRFVWFCVLFPLMYTATSFLFVYKFINYCHRVETQLKLINIISYIIQFKLTDDKLKFQLVITMFIFLKLFSTACNQTAVSENLLQFLMVTFRYLSTACCSEVLCLYLT